MPKHAPAWIGNGRRVDLGEGCGPGIGSHY